MIVKCPACNQNLDVPGLPQPVITNTPTCSVVVFEHAQPWTCTCGQLFGPHIAAIRQLDIVPRPVAKQEPPPRIVIPGRS